MEDLHVNPMKYPNEKCECGSEVFVPGVVLKKIPGIVLGLGNKDQYLDMPLYICAKCGKVYPEYAKIYKIGEYADAKDNTENDKPKSSVGLTI